MGKSKKRRRTHGGLEEDLEDLSAGHSVGSGRSTHGPPVATTSGRLNGSVPNDEWQTTHRTVRSAHHVPCSIVLSSMIVPVCHPQWEAVAEHFDAWRDKRVWMPFFYDGACAVHLRSLGFADVVHTDDDFFERIADPAFMAGVDFIWDNPPYTTPDMKERVLRALVACQKPFAMLLPISILHVGFVREIVPMEHVQAIIPRRTFVRKMDGDELPFKYLCWFCWQAELRRDLVFVDDGDID